MKKSVFQKTSIVIALLLLLPSFHLFAQMSANKAAYKGLKTALVENFRRNLSQSRLYSHQNDDPFGKGGPYGS